MRHAVINTDRLLKGFIELISISSPSFSEGAVGRVLEQKLRRLGCRVHRQRYDRSFNLIATLKGTIPAAPVLMLNAHMDTIEPTEGIRFVAGSRAIRSVGPTVLGADDKSAIAQILEALAVLRERKIPHGDVEVVFTSAEEKGLHGARHLDFGRIRARHALVLDSGGSVGKLVVAAPTHHTYTITVFGRAAHAGIEPEKGISAIRTAAEIIASAPDGRIDSTTTANIGSIGGGTATNVVPARVVLKGEVRSHSPAVLRKTTARIFGAAQRIARRRGCRITIERTEEYRSFTISAEDRFLGYMEDVLRRCRIAPERVATGGGSDANILNERGITAINLSTGMQKVHSSDEFILMKDLRRGAEVVLAALAGFPESDIAKTVRARGGKR